MTNNLQSIQVLEVNVYPFTSMESLVKEALKRIPLFSVNAEILLYEDTRFKNILNRGICYPDGFGAVMALKKKKCQAVMKLPGCELWLEIVKAYYLSASFYLIGCTDRVIGQTVDKLKREFPGINICGYRNGFIQSEQEKEKLKNDLISKRPDFVFIAMGFPRQEFLTDELYNCYPATYLPLGGSFDVYTNNVKRAPKWWIDHNIEFAYRLIRQPSRLKRQLHLIRFLFLLGTGKI